MQGTLALLIPIISVAGFFGWMLAISPVGKAYAERLRPAGRATEEAGERGPWRGGLEGGGAGRVGGGGAAGGGGGGGGRGRPGGRPPPPGGGGAGRGGRTAGSN